jgi:glycosyltransferase involved in cell wall biosynthesis
MQKSEKNRVLFLIQLPPPIHGASVMNQSVYNAIRSDTQFETCLIPLNFARDLNDLQKVRIGKVLKAFAILFKLIWQLLWFRPHSVYFSIVPLNFVLIRDALYLFIVKILSPNGKYVLHLHRPGLIEYANKWRLKWFYRFLFRGCNIIHLSESLIKREIEPLGLINIEIHAISNFIINIKPKAKEENENSCNNILFLSNLLPHKGYNILVDAFALLEKEFPKLTLTIAGPAPSLDVFKKLISKISVLGLDGKIAVVGKVEGEGKNALFAKASVFVLPSAKEYFPLVILEAMYYKIPVITGARRNLECYFEDKKDILYIDDFTPETIAKKISFLFDNPELMTQIAKNGKLQSMRIQNNSIIKIKELLAKK